MTDFSMSPEVSSLVEKTREFTRSTVLPVEDLHRGDIAAAGGDELRETLQAASRASSVHTSPSSTADTV